MTDAIKAICVGDTIVYSLDNNFDKSSYAINIPTKNSINDKTIAAILSNLS